MILSKLPGEVVINHVFPFLLLNDLLRLRRVSKFIKDHADDYLKLYGVTKRVITLIPGGKKENLSLFLSLKLPVAITRFHINNKNGKSWERISIRKFAKAHGSKITHLWVNSLEIPVTSEKVLKFFEALTSLQSLEITSLLINENPENLPTLPFPKTFKTMSMLSITNYFDVPDSNEIMCQFIRHCSPQLQYCMHPYAENNFENLPGGRFGWARIIVEQQLSHNPNQLQLKSYDLKEFVESTNFPSATDFYNLVTICFQNNVKLLNVDANLIEGMVRLETWDMEYHTRKLAGVIASLHYLHKSSFLLELPHLEKILIADEQGTATNCSMPHGEFKKPAWASLKELEIWVDSANITMTGEWPPVPTAKLLEYFFVGVKREKMENLQMYFYPDFYHQNDILPYPKLKDVCLSCPNLKVLKLGNWPGSSLALSRMWSKLPLLEEAKFENCRYLTDEAFIGKHAHEPSFLKLKKLKVLELDGLERSPGITDELFRFVLRNMPLKELILRSAFTPLKSITLAGIQNLLTGVFGESIEKFRLVGCIELDGVTPQELLMTESLFRSEEM